MMDKHRKTCTGFYHLDPNLSFWFGPVDSGIHMEHFHSVWAFKLIEEWNISLHVNTPVSQKRDDDALNITTDFETQKRNKWRSVLCRIK